VIVVNFQPRYNVRRAVRINLAGLPPALRAAAVREWTIDVTHSNAWNDPTNPQAAELQQTFTEPRLSATAFDRTMNANSVLVIELATMAR
jgi:hypothetical protein